MATVGPNAGGTFASDGSIGAVVITNPSNAQASDNSYATSVLLLGQISNYLKATNFGFTIPSTAQITGITVNVERSSTTLNGTHDDSIKLTYNGSLVGSDKASATEWPTSDAVATYGSSIDMWGTTWSASQINDSTFGVEISAIADLAGTAQVDFVSITVDYIGANRPMNTKKYIRVANGFGRSEEAS